MVSPSSASTPWVNKDIADLVFRIFFCSIFILLGGEHLFRDQLLQHFMPAWMPAPRLVSVACGLILLCGSSLVLVGYRSRLGAVVLAGFITAVTLLVHVPGVVGATTPALLAPEWRWLWDVFQRSNFVKNVCLLGVCCQLLYTRPGRYSVEHWLESRRRPPA